MSISHDVMIVGASDDYILGPMILVFAILFFASLLLPGDNGVLMIISLIVVIVSSVVLYIERLPYKTP